MREKAGLPRKPPALERGSQLCRSWVKALSLPETALPHTSIQGHYQGQDPPFPLQEVKRFYGHSFLLSILRFYPFGCQDREREYEQGEGQREEEAVS